MAAGTVYVVDDEPRMLRAIERLLRTWGHRVRTFTSAREFLEQSVHEVPGCLVLDLQMPEIGGLELQEVLAKDSAALPIIFITGRGDIASSVQAMKAGAVDFLTKPFEGHQLTAAIDLALKRSEQQWADREALTKDREAFGHLSPRERQVCLRIAQGMLNKQVGYELGITEKTVKVQRSHVMRKLGAASLADVVRLVQRLRDAGLLTVDKIPTQR